jgi:hypothetical protein
MLHYVYIYIFVLHYVTIFRREGFGVYCPY